MYIIPAIDILDGKVVRLREGDYDQKTVYDVSIAEMIETYRSNGTEFIHIIDLNGAKGDFSNQQALFDIIKKLVSRLDRAQQRDYYSFIASYLQAIYFRSSNPWCY